MAVRSAEIRNGGKALDSGCAAPARFGGCGAQGKKGG